MFRDGDYTTRVGQLTIINSLLMEVFYDRTYDLPYEYEEESHELLLTWNNDKMDLMSGPLVTSEVQFELTV